MDENKFTLKCPYSIDATVSLTDGKQTAKVTVTLSTGSMPTEAEANETIDRLIAESPQLTGFRRMTKREFFDQLCLDNYGQTFAMPGGEEWDK